MKNDHFVDWMERLFLSDREFSAENWICQLLERAKTAMGNDTESDMEIVCVHLPKEVVHNKSFDTKNIHEK